MKETILVPTDFSENAKVALNYALQMAHVYQWDVHLLHIYMPIKNIFTGEEFNVEVTAGINSRAQEMLSELTHNARMEYPELSISSACVEGHLTESIVNLTLIEEFKLIVMGTRGAGKIKSALIGSNTFDLIRESPIGVLAIPEDCKGFKTNTLGLLTNFKTSEIELLDFFLNRVPTSTNLTLLHVLENNTSPDPSSVANWEAQFEKKSGILEIKYAYEQVVNRLDYNSTKQECLEALIRKEKIDLLLVVYNRKSFFKQIFMRGLAKSVAHNLDVPTYFKTTMFD